jgi:hypothetical protein
MPVCPSCLHEHPRDFLCDPVPFPLDHDAVVREFRARYRTVTPGALIPGSANPLTPDLLGYVRTRDYEDVEVTTGEFLSARVIGLVWPRLDDGSADPRDRCCHSWSEVATALAEEAP